MKKLLSICMVMFICFSLCSCSKSIKDIKSNLKNAGYEIEEMTEEIMTNLNTELAYRYKGKGEVVEGFYAIEKGTHNSVVVIEFQYKSDLDIMYKMYKEEIDEEFESIDISGNILICGENYMVEKALD